MKKYEEYFVRINYKNGDMEDINFKGINTSDYGAMLDVYRDVKQEHSNDCKVDKIEFLGKSVNGELSIFFCKKVKLKTNSELNKDCREVVREVNEKIELLNEQADYHSNMITKYNKQRDTLYHMIESLDDKCDDAYKLGIISKIQEVSKARRYSKDQLIDIGVIKVELNKMNLNGFLKSRKEFTMTSEEYKDSVEIEIYYKDDKDKIELIEQHNKKFDKMIDDRANQLLYFYNNVGMGKARNQKQNSINKKLNKNRNRMVG